MPTKQYLSNLYFNFMKLPIYVAICIAIASVNCSNASKLIIVIIS